MANCSNHYVNIFICFLLPVPSQEGERSCIYVLRVSMLPVTPIIRLYFDIADSVVCLGFHFIETNHECLFQIHVYDNYLLNEVPFYFILMSIQHI